VSTIRYQITNMVIGKPSPKFLASNPGVEYIARGSAIVSNDEERGRKSVPFSRDQVLSLDLAAGILVLKSNRGRPAGDVYSADELAEAFGSVMVTHQADAEAETVGADADTVPTESTEGRKAK